MSDTKWNLPKIREACLELLGWRRETQTNFLDGKTDVIWTHTDGRERYEGFPYPDPLPDPTRSLDDALPLMERFNIAFGPFKDPETGSVTWSTQCRRPLYEIESPCLAVSLCALRCAGRDLDDFKVKP